MCVCISDMFLRVLFWRWDLNPKYFTSGFLTNKTKKTIKKKIYPHVQSQKCCCDRFFSFAMMPGSPQSMTFYRSCNFPLWLMCLFVPYLWVLQSWLIGTVFVHTLLSQTLQQHIFVFVSLSAFCHNREFSSLAKCTPWIPQCMWIAPSVFSSVSILSSQWPSVRASTSCGQCGVDIMCSVGY